MTTASKHFGIDPSRQQQRFLSVLIFCQLFTICFFYHSPYVLFCQISAVFSTGSCVQPWDKRCWKLFVERFQFCWWRLIHLENYISLKDSFFLIHVTVHITIYILWVSFILNTKVRYKDWTLPWNQASVRTNITTNHLPYWDLLLLGFQHLLHLTFMCLMYNIVFGIWGRKIWVDQAVRHYLLSISVANPSLFSIWDPWLISRLIYDMLCNFLSFQCSPETFGLFQLLQLQNRFSFFRIRFCLLILLPPCEWYRSWYYWISSCDR